MCFSAYVCDRPRFSASARGLEGPGVGRRALPMVWEGAPFRAHLRNRVRHCLRSRSAGKPSWDSRPGGPRRCPIVDGDSVEGCGERRIFVAMCSSAYVCDRPRFPASARGPEGAGVGRRALPIVWEGAPFRAHLRVGVLRSLRPRSSRNPSWDSRPGGPWRCPFARADCSGGAGERRIFVAMCLIAYVCDRPCFPASARGLEGPGGDRS